MSLPEKVIDQAIQINNYPLFEIQCFVDASIETWCLNGSNLDGDGEYGCDLDDAMWHLE